MLIAHVIWYYLLYREKKDSGLMLPCERVCIAYVLVSDRDERIENVRCAE